MIKEREEFHKWFNCSRRPAHWRIKREKGFTSGLIVPGDLLDRKKKCEKGFASGLIVPGDLPDRKNKTQKISRVV